MSRFSRAVVLCIESVRICMPPSRLLARYHASGGRSLERGRAEVIRRPEAKLVRAKLVYRLQGPAAARPLLSSLVATCPTYGSAYHLLGRVQAELGNEAAKLESYLAVHALDAVLDEALEARDVASLEHAMTSAATEALAAAPSWVRSRLAPSALRWQGRPSREQVRRGFDPRALAALEDATSGATSSTELRPPRLQLVLYRTNLLASADDELELAANLHAAMREVFKRTA